MSESCPDCVPCEHCRVRAVDELKNNVGNPFHLYPNQLSLFMDEERDYEGRDLLLWAAALPKGRDFIYYKDAGPGQFSVGEALRHFGFGEEGWERVHRRLRKANLIRELSWGVWEVTELARETVLAGYLGGSLLRRRPSTLAEVS